MNELNPYAAPAEFHENVPPPNAHDSIFKGAVVLYVRHWPLVVGAVLIVWTPLEFLTSYLEYFVLDPDDLLGSLRLTMLFDNLLGILASSAVILVGASSIDGVAPRAGAMAEGALRAWGRVFTTRLLSGLVIGLGSLFLVLPGIYLAARLLLAESIAVTEQLSGPAAMRRSFELTNGRVLYAMGVAVVALLGILIVAVAVAIPMEFLPELNHWVYSALSALAADLMGAYFTLCVFCLYHKLATQSVGEPNALV